MTQEDKELLLKDLCMRLPYGVKIACTNDTETYTLLSINWNKEIAVIGFEIDGIYATSKQKLADIKPYLRPMSLMTEEELVEFLEIRGMNLTSEKLKTFREGQTAIVSTLPSYSRHMDWLNKNMFDYRGLIEKGLALEASEEMYSTKKKNNYDTRRR